MHKKGQHKAAVNYGVVWHKILLTSGHPMIFSDLKWWTKVWYGWLKNYVSSIAHKKKYFFQDALESNPNPDIQAKLLTSPLYFTRTRGLFRECFPGEKSNAPADKEIGQLKRLGLRLLRGPEADSLKDQVLALQWQLVLARSHDNVNKSFLLSCAS